MVIYNVLVKGFSVGLTFSRKQAEEWKSHSGPGAEVVAVPYRSPKTEG